MNIDAIPLSVNYHLTRQCNYSCGFCFHTAKTSFVLPLKLASNSFKKIKYEMKTSALSIGIPITHVDSAMTQLNASFVLPFKRASIFFLELQNENICFSDWNSNYSCCGIC